MSNTVCEAGNHSVLYKKVATYFSEVSLSTIERKHFNETKGSFSLSSFSFYILALTPSSTHCDSSGFQHVKQLCTAEYSTVLMEVKTKYYSLAAAAALLAYVELVQNHTYAFNSLKVVFKGSEETTMIGQRLFSEPAFLWV